MRAFLLGFVAAVALSTASQAATYRNCLSKEEQIDVRDGVTHSPNRNAHYLFITSVLLEDDIGNTSSDVGYVVKGNLKAACDEALAQLPTDHPSSEGMKINSAVAELVPDHALKEGLEH